MSDATFNEIWDNIIIPMTDLLFERIKGTDTVAQVQICNLPQDKGQRTLRKYKKGIETIISL